MIFFLLNEFLTGLMAALFSLFGLIVIVICIVISTLLAVHFIMKSQQLKSMEHKK